MCIILVALSTISNANEPVRLRIASPSDPESVDPYVQLSSHVLAVSHLLYDPLVRFPQDRKLQPMLATSWKQVDPTTYLIEIRKGVTFHSGNPLTAEDVVWTINRIKRSLDFKGLFEVVTAEVAGTHTVRIKTSIPYPLTMNIMEFVFPMDSKFYTGKDEKGRAKDDISKVGTSYPDKFVSGTGPYILAEREPGKRVILKKNPSYWGVMSKVDEIQLIPIKEEGTRVAALLRGDVDIITPVPIQDYETLKKNKNIELYTLPTDRVMLFTLKSSKGSPLADKRVREALSLGTNIQGITERILQKQAEPIAQFALPYMSGYDPELKPRVYNIERAKELLAEAGYSTKNPLKLTMIATNDRYIKDEDIVKSFVAMMARIGVQISLKFFPKAQYWAQYDSTNYDIALIGWSTDTKDSLNYGEFLMMTYDEKAGLGAYNAGRYSNAEYDALLKKAKTELDTQKRHSLIKQSEHLLYDDVAYIPLFLEPISWAARKRVKNLGALVNPENFIPYNELIVD
ncbi:MAG: ABC transporter substrate-binding protein [Desulfovibrionaceae bacterium]|nr:ABC transporter substrate-binding protein [Desulfovibrionaceae bacterium]